MKCLLVYDDYTIRYKQLKHFSGVRGVNLRGTQLPNLSGNSEIRSSLIRSFSGPRMMTGRVYSTCKRWTVSYDSTASSDAILRIK